MRNLADDKLLYRQNQISMKIKSQSFLLLSITSCEARADRPIGLRDLTYTLIAMF